MIAEGEATASPWAVEDPRRRRAQRRHGLEFVVDGLDEFVEIGHSVPVGVEAPVEPPLVAVEAPTPLSEP